MDRKLIISWTATIILYITGLWPIGIITLVYAIRITAQCIKGNTPEPQEPQKMQEAEIEQKEIDIVRKSNDILLHLIQDKNREEDGH